LAKPQNKVVWGSRWRLRARITLAFFLFGSLLALLFATAVHFLVESIEHELIVEGLAQEGELLAAQHRADPGAALTSSPGLSVYRTHAGPQDRPPSFLLALGPGIHEVAHQRHIYQILVEPLRDETLYLVRDATLFETREKAIGTALVIAVIVAVISALSAGLLLSRRVIAPVTHLAQRVSALEPDETAAPLTDFYGEDEVGELAETFDLYVERIRRFVDREREFTSDASHELRTPLSVIDGAVELLEREPQLSARALRILGRIDRASRDMGQVLESLLLLAREDSNIRGADAETCTAGQLAREVIDKHLYLGRHKPVEMMLDLRRDFTLPAPAPVIRIMLGNLVRNALAYTRQGSVTLVVDAPSIRVRDTGVGIAPADLPRVFERHYSGSAGGSGLGLAIAKRICERFGWEIELSSTPGQGTEAGITFTPVEPALTKS
jgi:signal transduction histidine kinase